MRNLLKFLAIILLVSGLSCSVKAVIMDGGEGSKLERILTKVKDTLKTLGYIVCVIFIMWGGYLMIMSQGDPKQFERGKTALLYALIGLVVILIADNIVNFIQQQFQQ
jgi:hypothetical protein